MKKALNYGLLIFGLLFLIGFSLKRNNPKEQFNSEKWKDWTETETNFSLRWDMMNSLRNTHELKGKTKIEIIELLGNPEHKSDFEFRYYLGAAKNGIDTGNLTIKFDKNTRVTSYNVTHG